MLRVLRLVKSCSAASDHLNDAPIVLIKGQESRFQAPAIAPSRPKRRRLGRRSRRTRAGTHQGPLADTPCGPRACASTAPANYSVECFAHWLSLMIGRTSAANYAACVGVGAACALAGAFAKGRASKQRSGYAGHCWFRFIRPTAKRAGRWTRAAFKSLKET